MASKTKLARQAQAKKSSNIYLKLWSIPLLALLVKFIVISNIPGHYWLGADGENYVNGLQALLKDGIFSTEHLLSYWPAGYPLFLKVLGIFSVSNTLVIAVVVQSAIYAGASGYFVAQLSATKLSKYCFPVALILALNPTLSLNTIAIGYETTSAAIFIIVIGLMITEYSKGVSCLLSWRSLLAAGLLSFSSFIQPRFIASSLVLFLIWGATTRKKKIIPAFLLITFAVTAILPAGLILRNVKANNFAVISTNLGVTMNLGAGPGATGAYIKEGYGVPCDPITGNEAVQDSHLRNCVIAWYAKNPVKAIQLFYNKARFFWSPWSGPAASGSMARNPWLKISPLASIATSSQDGNNLVFGTFGKLVSYLWMIALILLMGLGFHTLFVAGGLARIIGIASFSVAVINWLISVGTLGDHRQRLPIMTLSLFLQVIGIVRIVGGKKYRIIKESAVIKDQTKL